MGRMFLGQQLAQQLDVELMQVPGFSIDQLMELAGLACACAIAAVLPAASRLLVVGGPGNNGGDALVASRHLRHFGYLPTVLYPKAPKATGNGPLYANLLAQCRDLDIPVTENLAGPIVAADYDMVLDGIFGFSFDGSGGIRAPFDEILAAITASDVPVASIDVPSGWHVERGDESAGGAGLKPSLLISLTAPKLCARLFKGEHHFLGGRFLPPRLADKYGLQDLPPFPGTDQCVRLGLDLDPDPNGAASC